MTARSNGNLWVAAMGLALGSALAAGCDRDASAGATLAGNETVLAEAEGFDVTAYDLDAYLLATLGDFGANRIDEAGRKKALEGLVATRVIAKRRDEEMDPKERAALDKKVEAYREQLLVKQYLAEHAPPEPITVAQIEAFYQENETRFGARAERDFEMLLSTEPLSDTQQRALLHKLAEGGRDDWGRQAAALRSEGYPIQHRRGVVGRAPLHSRLDKTLRSMRVGTASAPIFIRDRVYVLRVTDEKQHPARSLEEASGEIRERLAPLQVKRAIAQARAEAMKDVKVTYH